MNKMSKGSLGFTLVELMVAMVIGLLVMAGAIHIFVMTKRAFNEMEGLSARQEALRFVSDVIAADVRTASTVSFSSLAPTNCNIEDPDGSSEALVLQYEASEEGMHPRGEDPYCSSGSELARVQYFVSPGEGEAGLNMCYVCDGDDPVDLSLQPGVRLSFPSVANGVVEVMLEFDDDLALLADDAQSNMFIFSLVSRERVISEMSD
jgi:prepilin-type N-terminal cleavage/methylation domain-containing protein